MLEAHLQAFVPSPFLRKIDPSPTEALAFNVTAALLALGINYRDLHETVSDGVSAFINACARATESILSPVVVESENPQLVDAMRTATIAVALLGFLDAVSAQADFWKAGSRLALIQKVNQLLSEPFLVAVETSFSTIRNSHSPDRDVREWKRSLRQYAAFGRPLGAMLLQRSFMWLVVSSTSLIVTEGKLLRKAHILDLLMARDGKLNAGLVEKPDADFQSIDIYASLAVQQMNYIEAGADFVRLGTPSQQRLAYAVKSAAMIAFLNCSILNEDAADADILMGWLQETLDDPVQMADEDMASVALRCFALICHISPAFAPSVSRLLPRFLVQNVPHGNTVGAASRSLAFVLKLLSKDAIISTLYTLGNVLSPGSERTFTNGQANGSADGDIVYAGRHSTGSSISFQMHGEEETNIIYGNVVQAVCGIATACQDEKITALAQSMLLQKLDKVNTIVDSQIITGAASLALASGQLEFRTLLKSYSRICHIGVVNHNDALLGAVS